MGCVPKPLAPGRGAAQGWARRNRNTGNEMSRRELAVGRGYVRRQLAGEINELAGEVAWTVDLTTVYSALLLTVLAAFETPVRYLAGRAVRQASGVYRGGQAKTDVKDARFIADQSRMRGTDLSVLAPDDDLITELQMITAHRADLVADRTRTINRPRRQLMAVCRALVRVAPLTQDRGWMVLLLRHQCPKAIRNGDVRD
jgi:hypothetical protein